MKRIFGLAALLGHALASSVGVQSHIYGGARGAGKRYSPTAYYSSSRPSDARWWHDSKDLSQHSTILKAIDKRKRKADKLYRDARYSGGQNYNAYAANILYVNH